MMNKNTFYHLHIPKTGGLFLNTFLNKNLKPVLDQSGINTIIDMHKGWEPVSDSTYVITSLRDPVKRVVSHFSWFLLLKYNEFGHRNFNNKHKYYTESNIKDILNPTSLELIEWIDKNNSLLSNFQLKNMFYDKEDFIYYDPIRSCSPPLSLKNFSISKALDNLSKIDIVIKAEQVDKNTLKHIILEKILKDFNIKTQTEILDIDNNFYSSISEVESFKPHSKQFNSNTMSKNLYNTLSKKDIDYIENINRVEMDIYNTNSYFYNNGQNISPSN